ncbi:MAG: DNA polymerase III subunit gamma/tau [bacterium]|nr:DNA polymerase III subunit gamma/tau [bacterium]
MYQVFVLKYRPQTFDEVIGQPHITQTIINGIRANRIASAYLFAGPRGVGKTTMARILAKALNCAQGPTPTPCNLCKSCQSIRDGRSLDVFEIDGASNRGIDEIRELRERVRYVPTHSRYKIYIIDEVHMLTEPAFNALLKTLEEPPKHVVFVFATTAPYKIPFTILSRCQRFNFRKIGVNEIITQINKVATLEGVEIEESASHLIAQKVDGSLRDALGMFDQLIPYAQGKIKEKDVQDVLGLPETTIFFKLVDSIVQRDLSSILTLVRTTIDRGVAPKEFIDGLIDHLRTIFLIKVGAYCNTPLHEEPEFLDPYIKQASQFDSHHILRIIKFLFDTEKEMRGVLSPEIYLEQALVRVSSCTQVSIDEILSHLGEVSPRAAESVESILPAESAPQEPSFEAIWKSLIKKIEEENPSLSSFLIQGTPVGLSNGELLVTYRNEFFKTKVEEKLSLIENKLSEITNEPIHIVFGYHSKPGSLLDEPIVQKAIKIFNAEPIKP